MGSNKFGVILAQVWSIAAFDVLILALESNRALIQFQRLSLHNWATRQVSLMVCRLASPSALASWRGTNSACSFSSFAK